MSWLFPRPWRIFIPIVLLVVVAISLALMIGRTHGTPAAGIKPSAAPEVGISGANVQMLQQWVNSRDLSSEQLALLRPLRLTGGVPATKPGQNIKFHLGSFRRQGLQAVITASDAAGHSYRVGLRLQDGDWRIWRTAPGIALTAYVPASQHPVYDLTAAHQTVGGSGGCSMKVGRRLPVVLIHGLLSSAKVWGSSADRSSMIGALNSVSGTYVTTFDYSSYHTAWVDNPSLGPALADFVRCLAKSSRQGGGNGKVVLVGHSMGGLLARWAVTEGGVANDVGLIIDIATPNHGAALAGLTNPVVLAYCNASAVVRFSHDGPTCDDVSAYQGLSAFSSQIESLPWIPDQVQVHAVAGDVNLRVQFFNTVAATDTYSDLVVDDISAREMRANSGYTPGITVRCYNSFSCWHKALPRNRQVEQDVVATIRSYRDAHPLPVPTPQPTKWTDKWISDGGVWRVHGDWFQFKPSGSGLTGTLYISLGAVSTDTVPLTVTPQANSSLKLVTGSPSMPATGLPVKDETLILTPLGAHFAKITEVTLPQGDTMQYGNPYYCQKEATLQQHFSCNA